MDGYNSLAGWMSSYSSIAVFRRFMPLNVRNLLCLQAELVYLESDLKYLVAKDAASGIDEKSDYQYSIETLMKSPADPDHYTQKEKTLEIRAKLKEYSKSPGSLLCLGADTVHSSDEALLQVYSLGNMPKANALDLRTLRNYIARCKHRTPQLMPSSEDSTWAEEHTDDLTCLVDRTKESDILSKAINDHLTPWYHNIVGEQFSKPVKPHPAWAGPDQEHVPLHYYPDSRVYILSKTISVAVSSVMPTMAILGLYFIESTLHRIIATIVLTFFFALAASLLTVGRTIEIYVAVSAFAALLVAFISNSQCG